MTSEETIAEIARRTDTILLAFSCGKDSLAAWLELRPHFKRIIPVYLYTVPGLGFVERSIKYYSEYFGCKIHQYPQPALYTWLRNYIFQPPQHWKILRAAQIPTFTSVELRDICCEDLGLEVPTWQAIGTRSADSPNRLMGFKMWGSIREKTHCFYPIWDWRKARLVAKIQEAGVKLPPEYRVFGRSFDGLDFRFLYGIKQYWPEDYAKILAMFPMAELEVKRYEYAQQRSKSNG